MTRYDLIVKNKCVASVGCYDAMVRCVDLFGKDTMTSVVVYSNRKITIVFSPSIEFDRLHKENL